MKLTIGIKALNEERHIAQALSSALAAARPFGGEVILADCGSTDRTLAIASGFPVRVVQLADPSQRSCGTGAQLAFQHARGEFFYLLDGDMVLDPEFVSVAMDYLATHPDVAGVGGRVCEMHTDTHEFKIRAAAIDKDPQWLPGSVDRLDCGGLYRTDAVRATGYFADRNLHAFEEFDLGARLHSLGWTLARIDHRALNHYGHVTGSYRLLWRRLSSGHASAAGEIVKAAFGRSHFWFVVRRLSHVRNTAIVLAWWATLAAQVLWRSQPAVLLSFLFVPLVWLSYRRRSLRIALFSFASWNVGAAGLVHGLFRRRLIPDAPIPSIRLFAGSRHGIGDDRRSAGAM
jgi:glycosyltransferase involved in cell wall biosynthesis